MFNIGELVLYGAEGVCRVIDIEELDLTGETLKYYKLAPDSDKTSVIFVPTENSILTERLSRLLSEEEIRELLADDSCDEVIWSPSTSQRKNKYHEIVSGGDRKRLIRMIRELHERHAAARGTGHRFPATDEHYYKLAQKILYDEFSRAMPISKTQFMDMIVKGS